MKTVMQKIRTLAISLIICSCAQNNGSRVQAQNTTPEDTTTRQVTLLFAGDLMQHDGQIKAARTADGYDYTDVFARVKPEVSRYDIAVANFEVTLAGPPYKGYPCFSAPDEYLRAIIDAGFDVMLTSNNHSCDTRAKGLERTIVMMDSLKMPHLGTYRHQKEREQNYPFIIERNGIRIAMLNFTYGTNGIPVPPPYIVNLEDTAKQFNYSVSRISVVFKREMHDSIMSYFTKMKIKKACELITLGTLSLKDISDGLSYDNVQYFSTQFKKITGLTPGQFRNQSQIDIDYQNITFEKV